MDNWSFCLASIVVIWVAVILLPSLAAYLFRISARLTSSRFSDDVPVIVRDEWFSGARASIRQLTQGITTLLDGYNQYSRHGRPFVVHEPSLQQELMLPPEHVRWFSGQPDSKMASKTIREQRHAVGYLHIGVEFDSTLFFLEKVIRDSLTRNLDAVQGPMHDEIQHGFERIFGLDEEWKTVNVYDSFQKLILPVMARVFFGRSLSRDASFLARFERYNLAMGVGTIVIGQLPRLLKNIFVPFVNLPLRYYRRATLDKVVPEVRRQLSGQNAEKEESFVSQCAKTCARSVNLESAKDPRVLSEWLMLAAFAAMSSMVVQVSNCLLDVLSCDPQLELYQSLRSESESLLTMERDWKTTAAFNRMTLCDGVIRESLRYHPILIKGLTKEVVDQQGLQLPDGTHLPKGSWVGVPVLGIHRDERFYPRPELYDPYRFVRMKKDLEDQSSSELDAARPSDQYLGFGYGRHACPGRWFAVVMMKTLLAHLTMHYDVEATQAQAPMRVVGDAALPPLSATIRIRRRKL
jgi:cytochrome P450